MDAFINNLTYVIDELEKARKEIKNIKEENFFELSKEEVINYINDILHIIKQWVSYYNKNDYTKIASEYKKVEGLISELEMCLADYENSLKMNSISYTMFEIGNILLEKECD